MANKEIGVTQLYLKQLDKFTLKNFCVEDFGEIVDELGAANYKADAQLVASKDQSELDRIVDGFIAQKLGIQDKTEARKLLKKVMLKMDKEKRKYRAVVYYMLWDAARSVKAKA
jgi:hypothetical protein